MKKVRFSLSAKIFAGVFLVLALLITIDVWSLYQLQKIGHQLRLLKRGYLPLTKLSSHLVASQLDKKSDTQLLFTLPHEQWPQSLFQRLQYSWVIIRDLNQSRRILTRLSQQSPQHRQPVLKKLENSLDKVSHLLALYHQTLSKLQSDITSPHIKPNHISHQVSLFRQYDRDLRRESDLFSLQVDFQLTQVVLQTEREERQAVLILLLFSILALSIVVIVLLLSHIPLRRIQRLVEGTQRISAGDYHLELHIPLGDEIGVLANAFENMARSLAERDHHLRQKQRELEDAYQELQISSQRLTRSERLAAIGQVAAQITHEVRNPLNAIGLNLELLEEDLQMLTNATEALAVLRSTMNEVERLTLITEEYLRFARLPPPQLEPTDLNALISDTMTFLRHELSDMKIHWQLALASTLPMLNADQGQLHQALLNLIRNAIQAATSLPDHSAELYISTQKNNTGGVKIEICDNGPGIPPEKRDQLFTPFFSTKDGGTGLGLPLTYQIIQSHGGTITYHSRENGGTRFVLIFP
jgi:signal transduction histidine kinase